MWHNGVPPSGTTPYYINYLYLTYRYMHKIETLVIGDEATRGNGHIPKKEATRDNGHTQKKSVSNLFYINLKIPVPWLLNLKKLPPCAVEVAVMLLYLRSTQKRRGEQPIVVYPIVRRDRFKIANRSFWRGLRVLEGVEMVEVERIRGRYPRVWLNWSNMG